MVCVPSARLLVVTCAVRVSVTGGGGGTWGGGWPIGGGGGATGGGGSTTNPPGIGVVVVTPIESVKTSKNCTVPVGVVGCVGSKVTVNCAVNVTGEPTCCVGLPVAGSNGASRRTASSWA